MDSLPAFVGLVAASLAVLGAAAAAIRRVLRAYRALVSRVSGIEDAIASRRSVVFREEVLAECPEAPGGIVSVEAGTRGVVVSIERGRAAVRLANESTVVRVDLGVLSAAE